MTFDLKLSDSWEDQNHLIRGLLGITDSATQLGLYNGVGHALIDLLYGIKEFWPVKKTLVVISDGDPYLLSCLRVFVREGYTIQRYLSHEIGNVETWVQNLKIDTLAVIFSSDHAFTGELLVPPNLAELISHKKIYSIEIQHALHAFVKKPIYPWSVQVQHYSPSLAVVLQGARIRLFQHSAHLLDWHNQNIENSLQEWRSQKLEIKELILKFESKIVKELKLQVMPYFSLDSNSRLWDRTVLNIGGVAGEYFIHKLAQNLGVKLNSPGFEFRLETTHLCRWKSLDEYEWWGRNNNNQNGFKSLVIISSILLQKENFYEIFQDVVSACQKESQLI